MRARPNSRFTPALAAPKGLDSLLGSLWSGWSAPTACAHTHAPLADVREEGEAFVVQAEVPGLAREALQIAFDDGVLSLAGTWATPDAAPASETLRCAERPRGAFERRWRFGTPVAEDQITAELRDGVLTVRLPKVPEKQPRTIAISGGDA